MKRWARTAGISLLVASVLPYAYMQYRLRSHNWVPLEAPAGLDAHSQFVSPMFVSDMSGSYNVSLAFAPLDVDREECLVGDSLFKDSCKPGTDGLDLDWSVVRTEAGHETVAVDYRRYRPGWFEGAGSVETVLGSFEAQKGGSYKIATRMRNLAPELKSASPKIRVEAATVYWEKWVIFAQMSLAFAVLLGSFGIVVLVWGFFLDR